MQWLLVLAAEDPSPLTQVDDLRDWIVIGLTILFFVVFLNLLRSLVFQPVFALLDERQSKLLGGMSEIEHQRAEVERLKQDYDKQWALVEAAAAARTQSAIDTGKREVVAMQDKARAEYLELVEQGKAQLAQEFAATHDLLLDQVTELTFQAIERTLAGPIDRAAYEADVHRRLEEVIPA